MKLSIIIPQYEETDERVRPLLESIDIQRGIDFSQVEVIIVNDGSDVLLSEQMLSSFNNIKPIYLRLDRNAGPGLCRQAGLDNARGDYVTFCDADDVYHNVGILSLYFQAMRERDFEALCTSWLEECRNEAGEYAYVTHSREATWMHGKVFSRRFLYYNDIRFSEELLYHEDSYFNSILFAMADPEKCVYSDTITYMWTWDDGTITRRNKGAYSYESMTEFMHAIRLSCRWIKPRKPEALPEKVAQVILYGFYTITSGDWAQEYKDSASKELWELYEEFKDEFWAVPFERLADMQRAERDKLPVPYIERVTFYDYMANLERLYGEGETEWQTR